MTIDALIANNRAHAASFTDGGRAAAPSRQVAVVACMDARIHVEELLGLGPCEAHIIRNAGGLVTDDVLRSLVLSQRALGTRHVLIMQHTKCGVEGLDDARLNDEIERELGQSPPWSFGGFDDHCCHRMRR